MVGVLKDGVGRLRQKLESALDYLPHNEDHEVCITKCAIFKVILSGHTFINLFFVTMVTRTGALMID